MLTCSSVFTSHSRSFFASLDVSSSFSFCASRIFCWNSFTVESLANLHIISHPSCYQVKFCYKRKPKSSRAPHASTWPLRLSLFLKLSARHQLTLPDPDRLKGLKSRTALNGTPVTELRDVTCRQCRSQDF